MMPFSRILFRISATALLITSTGGFPSYLISTKIGCMTDLSIEEVMMNNEVKSPEESDFPKIHLVALDENKNYIDSPYHYDPSSSSSSGINIKFVNPYSIQEFPDDLYFVMEVEGPAEFIEGGTIGCDLNIRLSARLDDNDGVVILKVNDPTAKIRVWGGWATGQNSVRLTPDLILEPGHISSTKDNKEEVEEKTIGVDSDNAEINKQKKEEEEEIIRGNDNIRVGDESEKEIQQQKERILPEEYKTPTKTKKNLLEKPTIPKGLEYMVNKKNRDKNFKQEIIHKNKDRTRGQQADLRNIKQNVKDKHADLIQLDRKRKVRHKDKINEEHDTTTSDLNSSPNDADGEDDDNNNDNNIGDDNSNNDDNKIYFNGLQAKMKNDLKDEFDASRHFVACGFFAFSIGLIVMVFAKRHRDKGRRDL